MITSFRKGFCGHFPGFGKGDEVMVAPAQYLPSGWAVAFEMPTQLCNGQHGNFRTQSRGQWFLESVDGEVFERLDLCLGQHGGGVDAFFQPAKAPK